MTAERLKSWYVRASDLARKGCKRKEGYVFLLTASLSQEAEITTLKRQLNTTQQSQKRRPSSSHVDSSEDLAAQLSTKQATIETLESDVSNLKYLSFQTESERSDLESRISILTAELETSRTENASLSSQISTLTSELASAKSSEAPSSEAEGPATTQTQLSTTLTALNTAEATVANLNKKIETLQTLHRDSEARTTLQNALRVKEMDRLRAETTEMRKKLQARSYENARLRSVSTSSASAPTDETDTPLDADAATARIRELEAEVFELRSGVYRDWRGQLVGNAGGERDADTSAVFDEVDLSSPSVAEARARRAAGPYGAFSSLLNTFTGTGARRASRTGTGGGTGGGAEKHVGFLSEQPRGSGDGDGAEFSDEEGSFAFDEEAFRVAQEEEARVRLERVREVKRRLPEWKGWRVDLVDLRGGSMAGVFEV